MTIRAELIFALAAVTLVVSSANLKQAEAQASSAIPRAAGGKPDFNGIYEWPRALPRCGHVPLLGHDLRP